MAIMLEAGDRAPSFTLQDQDGATHRLSDYRGRTAVLYFYPRDFTPGCTKQACSLRDSEAAILEAGAVVLGVSTDDAESHQRFRAEHGLRFPLLVDAGAKVATRYGAWGEKTLYGAQEHRYDARDVHHRAGRQAAAGLEAREGGGPRRGRAQGAAGAPGYERGRVGFLREAAAAPRRRGLAREGRIRGEARRRRDRPTR